MATIGTLGPYPVNGGTVGGTYTVLADAAVGEYTVRADYSGGVNYFLSTGSTTFKVLPATLLTDVVNADADFKKIDGFDVLFGKGSNTSYLKLKNTNPGTFHYQLTLTNETGVTLHDKNVVIADKTGGSVAVLLTVPAMPATFGTTITNTITPNVKTPYDYTNTANSAFTTQSNKPVHVRPDDHSDDIPMTILYTTTATGGDCSAMLPVPSGTPPVGSPWKLGQPSDGTLAKCIYVTGMAIPKHGKAKLDVHFQFGPEGTDGWSSMAQTTFIAGFAFKSNTTVTLDGTFPITSLANKNYTGNQATGLVGAGQQVTAIGGFVFDNYGNGVAGAPVKIYSAAQTSCSAVGAAGAVATMPDGFYFTPVVDGTKWWVGTCSPASPSGPVIGGRFIDHKLAKKEFDEEDFYVTP